MTRPTADQVFQLLDEALPDSVIIKDLRTVLEECAENGGVAIEVNGAIVMTPVDVEITLVTKAFFKEYSRYTFGTYKVMAALGRLEKDKSDDVEAEYCFVTAYYNADAELITTDFHQYPR